MTEEVEVDEPVAAAAERCRVLPCVPQGPPSTPDKTQLQCRQQGHVASRCLENETKGERSALLFPHIN